MPLKKLILKPGVNRENTRYYSETGWYECDKVRFRQGTPESIGGWKRLSSAVYRGVCRALFRWANLSGTSYMAVGTNLKYYVESGGEYYDITPVRSTSTGTVTFTATSGSTLLTVTDPAHGCGIEDFVTFQSALGLGGAVTSGVLNQEYQVQSVLTANTYTIQLAVPATVGDVGTGGAGTVAAYQINVAPAVQVPRTGWGASLWGFGGWGVGATSTIELRTWSQSNFGEDLIFCARGGALYYWDVTTGLGVRAGALTAAIGASDVPTVVLKMLVSDVSRFVLAFGCTDLGAVVLDPMLVRWSDQESAVNWTPTAINQAGGIRLSQGSVIITAVQVRQEVLFWTDTAMYSMQFVGAPVVWSMNLLADNVSCISPNGVATASGVMYWMGQDKFYAYNGTVSTLNCDLRQFVFADFNMAQAHQVCAGTNEAFNEVWWFYCSADRTTVDRYVVYNYLENLWYCGSMGRTAWIDRGTGDKPRAATYEANVVTHEDGLNDAATAVATPINAYIASAEWDADDGHNFSFIHRILPDMTFRGSTSDSGVPPTATLTVTPLRNSGSGYNAPPSVAGSSSAAVVRSASVPIEEFTGQVYVRVRGRQFTFKIESNQLNTAWQLGAPRVDIRPDGRR